MTQEATKTEEKSGEGDNDKSGYAGGTGRRSRTMVRGRRSWPVATVLPARDGGCFQSCC
ncbi:hypothetical protein NVIE_1934 [Nitrososphaera viennensis EN76]|uniref:Uncharacterized protein n=1 Tax=Nitrososphaera viennensis EN76 TaxID=926571 RepID=A0A060HSK0_9ARCH|nr:hypothetical protein NVIE_1934 [Nitrososphaera viennensis EN76]